ncbi:MAG: methenyltetrahydromethanopterin cyclohydrolase [Pirellulaceae bacterium]|nr:methenyltetrahydromethanopterin cyclohydrolase [Pirellulaceae bacterium]
MGRSLDLNQRSRFLAETIQNRSIELGVEFSSSENGLQIDFGVNTAGGLQAGIELAKLSCGDLARIDLMPMQIGNTSLPSLFFQTDHPVAACMGAQYAGWPIQVAGFFSMGSGPIRCLRGREKLLEQYSLVTDQNRSESLGVLCLETGQIPPQKVIELIVDEVGIKPANLILALAPTSSISGTVQVVARCVETSLHKLHELGFDLNGVVSASGQAPIPPVHPDDLKAIGLTNDSILFGGMVDLWVRGEDSDIERLGEKAPSSCSPDFGIPFYELFKKNQFDFYKIDPHLFAPAHIRMHNLLTGRSFSFGGLHEKLLTESYGR